MAVLESWLTCLSSDHLVLITHITVEVLGDFADDDVWKQEFAQNMARDFPGALKWRCGLCIDNAALKISGHFVGGESCSAEPVEVRLSELGQG